MMLLVVTAQAGLWKSSELNSWKVRGPFVNWPRPGCDRRLNWVTKKYSRAMC